MPPLWRPVWQHLLWIEWTSQTVIRGLSYLSSGIFSGQRDLFWKRLWVVLSMEKRSSIWMSTGFKSPEVRNLVFLDSHHIHSTKNSPWHKMSIRLRSATQRTTPKRGGQTYEHELLISQVLCHQGFSSRLERWGRVRGWREENKTLSPLK